MTLFDQVLESLRRLSPLGWRDVFRPHGLDLDDVRRVEDLLATLSQIDRSQPGFEDFAASASRPLEPGDPARSLLYHALSSLGVHPARPAGSPPDAGRYPTMEEIDAVENLVYALQAGSVASRSDLVPAVMAYQYRRVNQVPHALHADLVFSRTGVARLGNEGTAYDPVTRGFVTPGSAPGRIRVQPSRFAVFLCEKRRGRDGGFALVGGAVKGDDARTFLVPVHKVFDGGECLEGRTVRVRFAEEHVSDKLGQFHALSGIDAPPGFDVASAPYVRRSSTSGDLVALGRVGSSAVVSPLVHDIVRFALQQNRHSGRMEVCRFRVPRRTFLVGLNRRFTSFHLFLYPLRAAWEFLKFKMTGTRPKELPRPAPEFVNVRHEVRPPFGVSDVVDLSKVNPVDADLKRVVDAGDYDASLFVDDVSDGAVFADVDGLDPAGRPSTALPAFSITTAPDFFPGADQEALNEWVRGTYPSPRFIFPLGDPDPLSEGRLSASVAVTRPADGSRAFDPRDETMVATLSVARTGSPPAKQDLGEVESNFLPDGASNEFAPGWDVTFAEEASTKYYTTRGLGSPFPEDAKLCAAAGTFWPSASPDASRTFLGQDAQTAIPMLDEEIGFHPGHPDVVAGLRQASLGWDGESGPYATSDGIRWTVHFASIEHSDYVSNTLAGELSDDRLRGVDFVEIVRRIEANVAALRKLAPGEMPSKSPLWLVSALSVLDWSTEPTKPVGFAGPGYVFDYARLADAKARQDPSYAGRLVQRVDGPIRRCRIVATGAVAVEDVQP